MIRRPRVQQIVVVIVILAAGIGVVRAQATADAPVIYRLDKTSTYRFGCLSGSCKCGSVDALGLRGTFVLAPSGFDGLFNTYNVTDVNWLFNTRYGEFRVTGSGFYKIGGEFAPQQELVLELDHGIEGEPSLHYDSGLVPATVSFPGMDVAISHGGPDCVTDEFGVRATPVPPAQIHPYRLLAGSTFQSGCLDTCASPLGPKDPTFVLVDMPPVPPFTEFAVVGIRWQAPATDGPLRGSSPVRGDGFYRYGGDVTTQHQLSLDLLVGAQPLAHFDSGLVPGGGDFPLIESLISIEGGTSCSDTVLDVRAAPAEGRRSLLAESPDRTTLQ